MRKKKKRCHFHQIFSILYTLLERKNKSYFKISILKENWGNNVGLFRKKEKKKKSPALCRINSTRRINVTNDSTTSTTSDLSFIKVQPRPVEKGFQKNENKIRKI